MYRNAIDLDFSAWNARQYAKAPLGAEVVSGVSAKDNFSEISRLYDEAYRAVTLGTDVPRSELLSTLFQDDGYVRGAYNALSSSVAKIGDEYRFVSPVMSATMFAGNSVFYGDFFGIYANLVRIGKHGYIRAPRGTYVMGSGHRIDVGVGVPYVAGISNTVVDDGTMAYIGSGIVGGEAKLTLNLVAGETCDQKDSGTFVRHFVGSVVSMYSGRRCVVFVGAERRFGYVTRDSVLLDVAVNGVFDVYVVNSGSHSGGLVIGNDITSVGSNVKFQYGSHLRINGDASVVYAGGTYVSTRDSVAYSSKYRDGVFGNLTYSMSSGGIEVECGGLYTVLSNAGNSYSSYGIGGKIGIGYIPSGLRLFTTNSDVSVSANSMSFDALSVMLSLSGSRDQYANISVPNMAYTGRYVGRVSATNNISLDRLQVESDISNIGIADGSIDDMSMNAAAVNLSGYVDFGRIQVVGTPSTLAFQKNPITGRNIDPSGDAGVCTGFYNLPEHNIPIGMLGEADPESGGASGYGMGIVWKRSDGAYIYLMKDYGSRRLYVSKMSKDTSEIRPLADGIDYARSISSGKTPMLGQGNGEVLLMRSRNPYVHITTEDPAPSTIDAVYDETTLDYLTEAWSASDSGGVTKGSADQYGGYSVKNNSTVVGDVLYIDLVMNKAPQAPAGTPSSDNQGYTGIAVNISLGDHSAGRFIRFFPINQFITGCIFSKWDGNRNVCIHISPSDIFMKWGNGTGGKSASGNFGDLWQNIIIKKAIRLR